jgi:hypothetical protein
MVQNAAERSAQSGPLAGRRKSASITPGAITTLQTVAADFAFAEAAVGDVVSVSFDAALVAGIICGQPYVAVAGHVRLPFSNFTAGTLTQTAINANVRLLKAL